MWLPLFSAILIGPAWFYAIREANGSIEKDAIYRDENCHSNDVAYFRHPIKVAEKDGFIVKVVYRNTSHRHFIRQVLEVHRKRIRIYTFKRFSKLLVRVGRIVHITITILHWGA